MDYAALKDALLKRLSMSTDDPAASQVGSLINEGLHLVEASHPNGWPWLTTTADFTTTSGTASYPFASIQTTYTLMKVRSVKAQRGTNWTPLTEISAEEADAYYTSSDLTDNPNAYWVEGGLLYLYPTPSAAVTVRVRHVIAEPDLVNDTDEPIMPATFHPSIISAGLVLYYETLQDTNRAESQGRRLDGWVQKMMTASRQLTHPPRVRVRDW